MDETELDEVCNELRLYFSDKDPSDRSVTAVMKALAEINKSHLYRKAYIIRMRLWDYPIPRIPITDEEIRSSLDLYNRYRNDINSPNG